MLNNFICCYFLEDKVPPFHNLKTMPLSEVVWVVENHPKLGFPKSDSIVEILLRIIFKKIVPDDTFNFKAEIAKVEGCCKLSTFKRLYVKRLFFSLRYIKCVSKKLGDREKEQQETGKNLIQTRETLAKIHSDYFHTLLLFHDKWTLLTMKEIVGMRKMASIAKNFLETMPAADFNKMAQLIVSNKFSEIPLVRTVVERYLNAPQDGLGGGGPCGKDPNGGKSETNSLFDFGSIENVSQMRSSGMSFAMNSTFSGF